MPRRPRIGVIGSGTVARGLVARIARHDDLDLAFVHARSPERADVSPELFLADLGSAAEREPSLIVEAAHPVYSREHGATLLGVADYLPLSVSALADEALLETLTAAAATSGHRLWLPHGALVGLDSLAESSVGWASVSVTFEKHPASLDFTDAPDLRREYVERTTVFDGVVADVARLLPRNVNAMVALAIATVGPSRCRARVVADPALDHGVLDVVAVGTDGARVHIRREQPMAGVSGTEMLDSTWGSVLRASHTDPPITLC